MDGNNKGKPQQRQYLLGVKNIGGNDREIDVDLLFCGSRSSESLSDLTHDTESESDFCLETFEGIGKHATTATAFAHHGAFNVTSSSRNILWMKQNKNLDLHYHQNLGSNARKQNDTDNNDSDFDEDITEMVKCMSHFDKVLEEQNTHPINETKLHDKLRIEGRITGQTDRDGSLSEGIKKDEGGFIMQRGDSDGDESFRETYGRVHEEEQEANHLTGDKWDDFDKKQSGITYGKDSDANVGGTVNMVSKVRCTECGMLCHPRRKTCDSCCQFDRSDRSCDQSGESCDHLDRGNYEAGIGLRGDESSSGLEQTRLMQPQLQGTGTQLIKLQQDEERTFCLQHKKNCANNKHEAAYVLPAGGFNVNATLPTQPGHKSITHSPCASPYSSLEAESKTHVQGGGFSIHNDINSAGTGQPISMEGEEGMDSCLQKEGHLTHVDGASERNEDTCSQTWEQPTLTVEEKKVGPFNGHKGAIEDSALDKEPIACQGVRMNDNKVQLPLMKKEDTMEREKKLLQSDTVQMQVDKSGEDNTSKALALKPGTVTDTGFEVPNSSIANIDICSIGSQNFDKVIASSKHESAYDGCRKCDMIETIDSSTNSIGAVGYIDSPATIPVDCIREDSAFHSGNSVWVRSGDSTEYSIGNTICDSNTSAVKVIPQNDGEGVSLHQCNMPNEIQPEQEHKGHKFGRQLESLQSSKLKNQYLRITVDSSGNEKGTDLVQNTQDSQLYYEWHETKQPHLDSAESLKREKGYQIAGPKEDLENKKGSQIAIYKQDSLECKRTAHYNLEGSSCLQGTESSLGDFQPDMINEKSGFSETRRSKPTSKTFENKTKLHGSDIERTSSQVITHGITDLLHTGNQDIQCQRQTLQDNMEMYSPLGEVDETCFLSSGNSRHIHGDTMENGCNRKKEFCIKEGKEGLFKQDEIIRPVSHKEGGVSSIPEEYHINQGHTGTQNTFNNSLGDSKCQSVQNNNTSKESMSAEQRPLDNPACTNPHGNGVVLRRKDPFLNYTSKTMKTGVKLRSGNRVRRDARLRYSASDIETLKKR